MSELHKRGLLTAVVCSEPFRKLSQTQARVFGVPDLPLIVIPHPFGDLTLEQVEHRAQCVTPRLVELIGEMAS